MAIVRRHPWVVICALLLVATVGVSSLGMFFRRVNDPILEINDHSLTTLRLPAATSAQDILPQVEQRGMGIDGVLRSGPALPIALSGNPFESTWNGGPNEGIDLLLGSYAAGGTDIALPTQGPSWRVSRSFNAVQETSGGSHRDSDGPAGRNFFQNSMPEISLYEHVSDDDEDILILIYGASAYAEFKRVASSSTTFKGTNGAGGVFVKTAAAGGEPELYTLTDSRGNTTTWFGFDGNASPAAGQIWKIEDAAGNVAFVGDASTASTAISSGYTADGYVEYAYDASDRRFTYTYATLDSVVRNTQVKAETKTGGTWTGTPTGVTTVAKVDYDYYTTSESHGEPGDLKLVTTTTPLTDTGRTEVKKWHLRFYKGTYDSSTNPGYPHQIKLIVGPEGTRNYDWAGDSTFDEDFLTETDANLLAYSDVHLEYDASYRVREAALNGSCGCGGGSGGTHNYEYETNGSYSDNTGYDTTWSNRTVVQRPDGSFQTQMFDEAGQPLSSIITDGDPDDTSPAPDRWVTYVERDSSGMVTDVHTPANITGYTHSTGAITASTSVGLIWTYTRETSGATDGYVLARKWKEGTSDTANYQDARTYSESASVVAGDSTVFRPVVASSKVYPTETTSDTGANTTTYTTTFYTGGAAALAIKQIDTAMPVVSTGNNGSNSAVTTKRYWNADGTLAFERSGDAVITYHEYTDGLQTKLIADADTSLTGSGQDFENVTVPGDFASSGTEIHHVTEYGYDPQGRMESKTGPDGRVEGQYYTELADERSVTIYYPKDVPRWYSPATMTVRNHAGKPEMTGTIAYSGGYTTAAQTSHIDESDSDPILAVSTGSLARMTTNHYNENGTELEESRAYFDIPASGAGADGTNYDATFYASDDSGRSWRTKAPHGTITRTVYDGIGRRIETWVGTNDNSFAEGEPSGTDNMVKTEAIQYDGGSDDGNSLVTQRTMYIQDSATGARTYTYSHDVKGNVLLETMPIAPHSFHKFDNLGRRLATSLHTSTAGIVVGTDDPTTETAARTALSETAYDEVGRTWKSTRHEIDASDGSDDDTLTDQRWYDEDGRVIKVVGSSLAKTRYDRLGRVTRSVVLASTDDTTYAHAGDLSGDVVMEERHTVYEDDSSRALLSYSVARDYGDEGSGQTTGQLDSEADSDRLLVTQANLTGRPQIQTSWYDVLGRPENQASYGTNNGSNLDRDGLSVPSRSDSAHLTTTTYNDDGTVQTVTDPAGKVAYFEYDDLGRKTKEVKNYNAAVNSGNPSGTDDNVTVLYGFTDGLQTTLTADMPSGTSDQVTTYTYGTTKGASAGDSKFATGHLLQKTAYPDSTGDSDTVKLAYNAQGQVIWKKDQAGNIYETDVDDLGRSTSLKWTTAALGDTAVRRIDTAYDTDFGGAETVTQYDATSSGNAVNAVRYTRDGWGNLITYEEDRDSAMDASPANEYSVGYTYAKATGGRQTVRKTGMTLPSGNVITYAYESTDSNDNALSRVTQVKDGATVLAQYEYFGNGMVASTAYDEPDVFSTVYDGIDRHNRITQNKWTKDLATDRNFYHISLGYDWNNNITSIEDNVHVGFDVKYTMDDTDRLTRAEEGTLSGGSITSRTRDQQWTLDHVGNWDRDKLDLNGDGDWGDTDEWDDSRTHNDVNEMTTRDLDSTPGTTGDNYSQTFDALGQMTDDGTDYEYVWDGFGRLRKILDTSDQSLIAEYQYNGLGHMVARHEDTDGDDDVDSNDKWFYLAYDERWRHVATFREDDSDPKEEFVPHQAGLDGAGGSSYIDLVICRDRDESSAWTSASDGALETRIYYCQNWRADVSAIVEDTGEMVEWVKYSAYGVPFGLPRGDTDSDGDCDATDRSNINASVSYDVREDRDLDGDVDGDDETAATNLSMGVGTLSGVGSCLSWSGLVTLGSLSDCSKLIARNRVMSTEVGRWISRDPMGHAGGVSLYQSVGGRALVAVDPSGLFDVVVTIGYDDTIDPKHETFKAYVEEEMAILNAYLGECCKNNYNYCGEDGKTPFKASAVVSDESVGPADRMGPPNQPGSPTVYTGSYTSPSKLEDQVILMSGPQPHVLITGAKFTWKGTWGWSDTNGAKDGIAISWDPAKTPKAVTSHELGHFGGFGSGLPGGGTVGSPNPPRTLTGNHIATGGYLMSEGDKVWKQGWSNYPAIPWFPPIPWEPPLGGGGGGPAGRKPGLPGLTDESCKALINSFSSQF